MEQEKSCLNHLHICNAECCRQFKILINPRQHCFKGQILKLTTKDKDLILYYKLHGANVVDNIVYIQLKDFKKVGKKLIIYTDCEKLEACKCTEHYTKNRPRFCDYPNKDGTSEDVYFTENCIFK